MTTNIPLVDLKAQYLSMKQEIDAGINRVIEKSSFILGPEVEAFEHEMSDYLKAGYAIGVASGTEALQLALLACDIKPGDEVITPPFTFIATTEAIAQCGAVPVFVDIDPRTYNINPDLIEKKITKKTKALMPVHLYGEPAEMSTIKSLAQKYNLKVIEDCAQSMGAEYNGKKVGTLGNCGCFSFFPSKILGAYGDGGMVTANDAQIAENVKMLRNHGAKTKYYHLINGFNSRLDGIQAAILRAKLKYLDKWIALRRQKSELYSRLLAEVPDIIPPYSTQESLHVFNYYTIRVKDGSNKRGELQKYLTEKGISNIVYYPVSLHLQDVYRNLGYKPGDFPESERAQDEVLSLPIYPELEDEKIEYIASTIKEFSD